MRTKQNLLHGLLYNYNFFENSPLVKRFSNILSSYEAIDCFYCSFRIVFRYLRGFYSSRIVFNFFLLVNFCSSLFLRKLFNELFNCNKFIYIFQLLNVFATSKYNHKRLLSHNAFTCSNSIETPERYVKFVQRVIYVILVSFRFHTLFWSFHCLLWTSKCQLERKL